MPTFDPDFIARAASGHWTREPVCALTGFGIDTRRIGAGTVFVVIKSAARDGHAFLAAAEAAGASAALVAKPDASLSLPQLVVADPLVAFQAIAAAHRNAFSGPVVGISGSAGKTSTKDLLALLLTSSPGQVLATEGNLNNHLGVPLTLTRLDSATHRFAVIEAGIGGPGEMAPLAAMIQPDLAIITLVSPAHLEALGSIEGVAREKSILPAAVRPGGLKLFAASCAAYESFRNLSFPTRSLNPNISHSADATRIRFIPTDSSFEVEFYCRRISSGMAGNAALALAAALHLGVSSADAQLRINLWKPAALRGELRRDAAGRWLYVDCYNANPASMHDALAVFADLAPAALPRLYIVGGMEELGVDTVRYHREFGIALAARLRPTDLALVLAAPAAAAALVQGSGSPAVIAVPDLASARYHLDHFTGSVFIKGSRRYQLESLLVPSGEIAAHSH
jgi:UDP-N-acetylmuramoyl-tripeptide--D-alanyl-D-alanine ligase